MNHKIEVVMFGYGQDSMPRVSMPCVVSFEDGGKKPLIGHDALNRVTENPGRVISDITSIMTHKLDSDGARQYQMAHPDI